MGSEGGVLGRGEELNHKSFTTVAPTDPTWGQNFVPLHRPVMEQRLSPKRGPKLGERLNCISARKTQQQGNERSGFGGEGSRRERSIHCEYHKQRMFAISLEGKSRASKWKGKNFSSR